MKALLILSFAALSLTASSETIFTIPQGYTKVTIAGATGGTPNLTAISATLLRDVEFSGAVTLGGFTDNAAPATDTQEIAASSGTPWSGVNYTIDPNVRYLAYVVDSEGAEQAFLISANSDTVLTLEVPHDLAAVVNGTPRFPASTTVKIRKANTLISIFGAQSAELSSNDTLYIWDGDTWASFNYSTSQNRFKIPGAGLSSNANHTVVYPDEGIFVSRTETDPIVLTLFGEVPSTPQVVTIPGNGFMSNRVPVDTTLVKLGIATESWTTNDNVYIWNGSNWDSYTFSTSQNRWKAPGGGLSSNANDTPVSANTAVFISRNSPVSDENGSISTELPYTLNE